MGIKQTTWIGIALVVSALLALLASNTAAVKHATWCESYRAHVRNENKWVESLQDNDKRILPTVTFAQRRWVRNRIRIFQRYIDTENRLNKDCGL